MVIVQKYSSIRGSTTENHIIYCENNVNIKSYAALILLNEQLRHEDVDYKKEVRIQVYLNKRYKYLWRILIKKKDLVCHYCGRKHLYIGHRLLKYAGIDSKRNDLATIDHVIPRSSGIDPMDETNWVVACRKCNGQKGAMDYKEFKTKKDAERKNKKN